MTPMRRQHDIVMYLLVTLAALVSSSSATYAQDASAAIPDNATATTYGQGWRCDEHYREAAGSRARIVPPADAYLKGESYGSGWDCTHGFVVSGQTCVRQHP